MRFAVLSFVCRNLPRARVCEKNINLQGLRCMQSLSITMATVEDLKRVKERADRTEMLLENLKKQVDAIKKAAVKEACLGEEKQLVDQNEKLKQEVGSLKMKLIVAEMANGVRQVYTPTSATIAAKMSSSAASEPASTNDQSSKVESKEKPPAKENVKAVPSEGGEKKGKAEKKEKESPAPKTNKGSAGGGDNANAAINFSQLDFRVGKIVEVELHPDAASLYIEKVDLGEGKTRTILSGLVSYVPINEMQNRLAIFMCNLKPAKFRGRLSEGMIMCAVTPEKKEILLPPPGAVVGDRVCCPEYPGEPDAQLNPKKKIWETLKSDVRTNNNKVATYKGSLFTIEGKGNIVAPTLSDAEIS